MKYLDKEREYIFSKELYFKFFKKSPTPIHIFQFKDNDFILVDFNDVANKVLQGKLNKYLGSKVSELFAERPEIIDSFFRCLKEKKLIKTEYKYYFKIINQLKNVLVEFEFIDPDFILVHYEDITKRKSAEEKLKTSQAKYHSLFKHSPVGIAIFNEKGILIDSNPITKTITGYKKEDIINFNFRDIPLFIKDHFKLFNKNLQELKEYKKSKLSEIQIKKKNGDLRWILYQLSSFKLNNIPYYQCIFQDINTLKTTEKNLKDSKDNYQNLIKSVPDIIIKIDFDGKILFASPQVRSLLGYSPDNLIGKKYYNLIHPGDLDLFKQIQRNAIITGNPASLEYRLIKSDGTYLPVGGRGKLINNQGKLALLGVVRDFSDKKNTENLLEDKLKLETLISNISSRFIFTDNFNNALQNSLEDMANFINARRAYVFLFDENKAYMSNSHEWCAAGTEAQIRNLQNIPLKHFPWLLKRLNEGDPIHITKSSKIFTEIKSTFKFFETELIKSILIFPIFLNEDLGGFIGFDDVEKTQKWDQEDLSIFQIPSEIIGTSLERRLTEKTLAESHKFLDRIISSIPNYMCIIDNDYKIIWVNEKAQGLYNGNIIGQFCYRIFRESNNICQNCPAQKTFNTGKIHQEEIRYLNNKTEQRIISTNTNVISKTLDGKAELVVIIGQDITKFKKTEQDFKLTERKYRVLFEQAEHGILLIDPDNISLVDFNEKVNEYLGYTREEFEQTVFHDLINDQKSHSFNDHIHKVLENKKDVYKTKIRNKNGKNIDLVIFSLLFRMGNKKYMQTVFEFDPNNFNKLFEYIK